MRERAARGAPGGVRGVLPDAGASSADVRDGAGPAGDGPAGGRGAVAAGPSRGQRGGPGPNRPGREHGGEGRGMSMGRNLRAGLIGLGMMGRHHARNLKALEGVDLVAVADAHGDPHGAAAGLEILPDVEALIAAGIDYAVVAVPTQFHRDVALRLAHAGMVGAVRYIERYNPAMQEMRRQIADGQLGEIYQIATRRQGGFPARIADVGVVKDLATHDLDLTAWVSQSPYAQVAATSTRRSGREDEDMVSVAGCLADGTITNHMVNWLSPFKERMTVVTGQDGALVADTLNADLTFHANGEKATNLWESM